MDREPWARPAFTKDGTVTAGNSSPINDGAIAVIVGSARAAAELGAAPLGWVVASSTVAVEPHQFSVAPVPAIHKVLGRAGLGFADISLWEISEAFAAVVLSCLHELPEVDRDRVNPHGGAIAIGHPLAFAPSVYVFPGGTVDAQVSWVGPQPAWWADRLAWPSRTLGRWCVRRSGNSSRSAEYSWPVRTSPQ